MLGAGMETPLARPEAVPPDLTGLRADQLSPQDRFQVPSSRPQVYLRAARWYLQLLKRDFMTSATNRDAGHVRSEYEGVWTPTNQEFADHMDASRAVFLVRGRPVFVNGWFIVKRYTDAILEAILRLKANSVLEVGSGRGRNLALFALRRPELQLTGLELTSSGVDNSRKLATELPEQFLRTAEFTGSPEEAKARVGRIAFHQGNAMQMPFPDKSFDVSFTSLVLEQLPRDFPRVLQEMRRVTRGYCIFNEAFTEANGWRGKAYLRRLDYFQASQQEFARHGLEPIYFTTALPQKLMFRSGLLVARVT